MWDLPTNIGWECDVTFIQWIHLKSFEYIQWLYNEDIHNNVMNGRSWKLCISCNLYPPYIYIICIVISVIGEYDVANLVPMFKKGTNRFKLIFNSCWKVYTSLRILGQMISAHFCGWGNLNNNLYFLLLSLGVDDAFVLTSEYLTHSREAKTKARMEVWAAAGAGVP